MGENNFLRIIGYTIFQEIGLPADAQVLAAVSGGPDSVCLAWVLKQHGLLAGLAHVNYQLRSEDSDLDEASVRALGEQWEVPVFVKKIPKAHTKDEKGASIQMAARKARYEFFEALMESQGWDYCATAHHQDDEVETLLMNLFRGDSPEIFQGIPTIRFPFIRPLLGVSKAHILQVLDSAGLDYRTDTSNQGLDYSRNVFRNRIIPSLEEVIPGASSHLLKRKDWFQLQASFLKEIWKEWIPQMISGNGDIQRLDWQPFVRQFGAEFLPLLVWEVMTQWGIIPNRIREILGLIHSESGRWVEIHDGRVYRWTNGLERIPESDSPEKFPKWDFLPNAGRCLLKNRSIIWEWPFEGKPDFANSQHFYLDIERLEFPLILRRWKEGDRMQPFGLSFEQKLSDIFINEKFSPSQKQEAIIWEDQQGIVAISGYRISERVKITKNTRQILKIVMED
ncbi:tRNA lysidine(34) synthetase TilS [Pontibacter sp. G13]|uniref:tRNA lysidine(34) synthetase TilS n=1 Tax=Pontibacter sp. G13 TaxID=3074898 RepID=UPI00288BCCFB|nr:tRNA lysidine(34) synthetase TilS [Pontibacter sp. G13]WNJ18065.1 tRNA lysidine(34) synthetase TilS [Pontibacter sp. G13]